MSLVVARVSVDVVSRPFAERSLERGRDALARKLPLAVQKVDDAGKIGLAELNVAHIRDLRLEENSADGVYVAAQGAPDFVGHPLDRTVILHELQRLLRTDSLHASVEICPHEHREIDELLARNAQGREQSIQFDQLRNDRTEDA